MKLSSLLFAFALLLMVGLPVSPAHAQAANSGSSSLTFGEKMKLNKVRQQVFANNPDLKAEGEALQKQGESVKNGDASPAQKMKFARDLKAHQKKMRAAMLQIDPTLGPLIDKAEANMKEKASQ